MDRVLCGLCAKPMVLAFTESGNLLALDADPSPEGSVTLIAGKAFSSVPAYLVPIMPRGCKHTYHTDTCPKLPKPETHSQG